MHNDDFEITSTPGENGRALEILAFLLDQKDQIPLSEIQARAHVNDENLALINTAAELAALDSNVLFRKRNDAPFMLASIWLGTVLRKARQYALEGPQITFNGLALADLRRIARLSVDDRIVPQLPEILRSEFGVLLVIEKAFPLMKLDGVTTKLPNGIPVVGVSVRYARYDYFWFTLLHELAHIALHYDELSSPILDDMDMPESSDMEVEANRAAADAMVPRRLWVKAAIHRSLGNIGSETDLQQLAHDSEVHQVLVAGLLRKKHNNYHAFSKLVNSIDTRALLGIR